MKIDRLLGIITTLLQRGKVTAPYLAQKFEVSRRTILRDLDDICRAGIPIVTTQGGDGGISIAEGYKLDKSVLTTGELQSIIAGLRSIQGIEKPANIERLVQKLVPGTAAPYEDKPHNGAVVSLRDSIVIDLASHYKNDLSEKIGRIKEAVNDRRLIEFDYYYPKGETHRRIEPYFIAFKWSNWYVFGYCAERQDFRVFKLNRLWELSVTKDVFTPREIPPDRLELGASLVDTNEVKVLFDPSVRYRLIEDFGFRSFKEKENGELLFTVGYTNKDYILSWILAFGDKATVVSPVELRDEVRQIAENIVRNCTRT
jgi:predicted DNA-binding transcriptional regulator YafY